MSHYTLYEPALAQCCCAPVMLSVLRPAHTNHVVNQHTHSPAPYPCRLMHSDPPRCPKELTSQLLPALVSSLCPRIAFLMDVGKVVYLPVVGIFSSLLLIDTPVLIHCACHLHQYTTPCSHPSLLHSGELPFECRRCAPKHLDNVSEVEHFDPSTNIPLVLSCHSKDKAEPLFRNVKSLNQSSGRPLTCMVSRPKHCLLLCGAREDLTRRIN